MHNPSTIFLIILLTFCVLQNIYVVHAVSGHDVEDALKDAIEIDFSIYNRNDEFYITILSEEGYTICEGKVSRTILDQIHCAYDKDVIKYGDNLFFITIYSLKKKEIVAQKTTHFYYDGRAARKSRSSSSSSGGNAVSWKWDWSPITKPFRFVGQKVKQTGQFLQHQTVRLSQAIVSLPKKLIPPPSTASSASNTAKNNKAKDNKAQPKVASKATSSNAKKASGNNPPIAAIPTGQLQQHITSFLQTLQSSVQKVSSTVQRPFRSLSNTVTSTKAWQQGQALYSQHQREVILTSLALTSIWIAWLFYAILIDSKDPAKISMNPFHLSPFHKPPPPPAPKKFNVLRNLASAIKYHSEKSVTSIRKLVIDKPLDMIQSWQLKRLSKALSFVVMGALLFGLIVMDGGLDLFKPKPPVKKPFFALPLPSPPAHQDRSGPSKRSPPKTATRNPFDKFTAPIKTRWQQVDKEDLKTRLWIGTAILLIQGFFTATRNRCFRTPSNPNQNYLVPFQSSAQIPRASYF